MTLFRQYFKQQLTGLVIWMGLTGLLTGMIGQTATTVGTSGVNEMLERMPEALRNMMGITTGLSPIDSFVAVELGAWGALLVTIYAMVLALGVVTREVDRRTIDFLLSQPVDRREVMLARLGVVLINTALLAATMWVSVWLPLRGSEASLDRYALVFFNQWLLAIALGGTTLLSSIWIDDYSFGIKLWLGLASTAFFLEFVLKGINLGRWIRFFSPFSYVDAPAVVRDGLPVADLLILLTIAVVTYSLALPAFERKQIAV